MSDNAPATLRGFRNQALYVLHRLLTDGDSGAKVYRPEGAEDLAIFDSAGRLVEAVQVKDHSGDLALSALKPKSGSGFFERLKHRRTDHPSCRTTLASFGPIGPELAGAIGGNPMHRAEVLRKLCADNRALSESDARMMLDELRGNLARPVARILLAEVGQAVKETVAGGAVEQSVELLLAWIYRASETRLDLTRQAVLVKLERIGQYLAALRDLSAEWEVSLEPVRAVALSPEEKAQAITEYRRGVQAGWKHIVAQADCPRVAKLWEIHREMQRHSVVFVRGASGQGKSTLGWRYLHDFCAEGVRFHVRFVEGRNHARRIANALGAHVRRLEINAVAYLDVSPSDSGWTDLARELVGAGLKVLVAVRHEDFRRANIAYGDFDYSEVDLDRITREEAELIFGSLHAGGMARSLDFEEAWSRFASQEGGPLMEFTHLVSEGVSLTSRIASQVRRIQEDAAIEANGLTHAHLDLLTLAAVANESGARVSLVELCSVVGIHPLTGPLKVLEHEYLLRIRYDGKATSVVGIHALRSRAIVTALFAETPELWREYAARVLPLVVDEDLEPFLLAAFSRRPEAADALITGVLGLPLRSWTQAAGIAGALLWEGASRYEQANRKTLLTAIAKYDSAWWLVCDTLVGMDEGPHREIRSGLSPALNAELEPIALTPKQEVFAVFIPWARSAQAPPAPSCAGDWLGAGNVAYWVGHTGSAGMLRDALEELLPSPIPKELSIEDLGQFICGRSRLGDPAFARWLRAQREAITQVFLTQTDSVHISDDGTEIKVHFLVPLAEGGADEQIDAGAWNEEAVWRIRQIRHLYPDRETYSAQGIGIEVFIEMTGYDPTCKRISARNLPMERSVQLNATFRSLVAYRLRRPATWQDYTEAVLAFREAASDCFRKLYRAWATLLPGRPPKPATLRQLPEAEMDRLVSLSKELSMLPRSAVDEWGFVSEETEQDRNMKSTSHSQRQRWLGRFNAWKRALADFESGVTSVGTQIVPITVQYAAEQSGSPVDQSENRAYQQFLANLGRAWEALRIMQDEFRKHFATLCTGGRLDTLEAHERSNFRHLWATAFGMRYERQRHVPDVGRMIEPDIARRRSQFLQCVRDETSAVAGDSAAVCVREAPWMIDGTPSLCITLDYSSLEPIEVTTPRILQAVWRAAQAGGWRDLEWKPIEIEWPKIAVVALVRGKALAPACAQLSTATAFCPSDTFEVKAHHHFTLPVEREDFERGGFDLWKSPLLRAAIALQDSVLAFVVANMRFHPLARLVHEQHLGPHQIERIQTKLAVEMTAVLTDAQRCYSQLARILRTAANEVQRRWTRELLEICEALLFAVEGDSPISIDLESFAAWGEKLEVKLAQFRKLTGDIVTFALEAEHAESSSAASEAQHPADYVLGIPREPTGPAND